MNESRGADGNSWTVPTTWNGTTRKLPVRWSSTRSFSRSPGLQRVVGDRLLRDEDPVAACCRRRLIIWLAVAAEEVGVAQRGGLGEASPGRSRTCPGGRGRRRRRSGRAAVVAVTPGHRGDLGRQVACSAATPGGALTVTSAPSVSWASTLRLLVVGGGEDREAHAEGEQQPDHDEAAVDRRARGGRRSPGGRRAATRGCRERPAARARPASAAAQADQQQRRPDPEQRRPEEHVDRQRQGRVRVRVDDRREAGAHGQPVDQAAERPARRGRGSSAARAARGPDARCDDPRATSRREHRGRRREPRARPRRRCASSTLAITVVIAARSVSVRAAGDEQLDGGEADARPDRAPRRRRSRRSRRRASVSRSRRRAPRARSSARSRRSRSTGRRARRGRRRPSAISAPGTASMM